MKMMRDRRKRVALAIGDPAGIGCEVALRALADARVAELNADFVVVGDFDLVDRCNSQFGIGLSLRAAARASDLTFKDCSAEVLHVGALDLAEFTFGAVSAANGRALIAYAQTAIGLAMDGFVDAIVAAPQNQTSVHMAGIAFDGYSSFAARVTETPEEKTYLMALSERFRVAHVTLHVPLREVINAVRRERVLDAICATDAALRRIGVRNPRIAVSGLNPHAGEHGLFGSEESTEIAPAIADARVRGINVDGPTGADLMFAQGQHDAYVVMFHDQGHIPVKLEHGSAGIVLGLPILFASVAHGSAHDIAGRGVADPTSFINAITWSIRPGSRALNSRDLHMLPAN